MLAEAIEATPSNGGGTVDPASVRPRLAEAAAASPADIRRLLLETATGADRQLWATITCKHCSKPGRYEITVPGNKVRLDAIQALLHESHAVVCLPAQGARITPHMKSNCSDPWSTLRIILPVGLNGSIAFAAAAGAPSEPKEA